MTDLIAVIAALATLVAAFTAAIVAIQNGRKAEAARAAAAAAGEAAAAAAATVAEAQRDIVATKDGVFELGKRVDGRLSELLALTEKAARAAGRLEGPGPHPGNSLPPDA